MPKQARKTKSPESLASLDASLQKDRTAHDARVAKAEKALTAAEQNLAKATAAISDKQARYRLKRTDAAKKALANARDAKDLRRSKVLSARKLLSDLRVQGRELTRRETKLGTASKMMANNAAKIRAQAAKQADKIRDRAEKQAQAVLNKAERAVEREQAKLLVRASASKPSRKRRPRNTETPVELRRTTTKKRRPLTTTSKKANVIRKKRKASVKSRVQG